MLLYLLEQLINKGEQVMDEVLRREAALRIEKAQRLERKQSKQEQSLSEYWQGINLLLKIANKTNGDIQTLAMAYYSVAILYFNRDECEKAAQGYQDSIQQLQKTELNDTTYRRLTERYIDLADVCYALLNKQGRDESIANAITAFKLIKEKNSEELAIGDPVANFERFHHYYERKLSTKSYLNSVQFKNHEMLLTEKQQENSFLAQFGGISIEDDSIEHVLKQLSVSEQPQVQSFFSAVSINQALSDADYCVLAHDFLQLAKTHSANNLIANVVTTCNQGISAWSYIQKPNEQDQLIIKELKNLKEQIIQKITEQIALLKTKNESAASSSAAAACSSSAAVATASFFGQTQQRLSSAGARIDTMDDSEDEDVAMDYRAN